MTTVLITGANRGIGLGLVRQYVADGADVIACCREPAAAGDLQALAKQGRVRIMQLDVADEGSIAALKRALGDEPIDIIVNNAGILGPVKQSAEGIDTDGWMTTMRVNALGPILIAQALRGNLLRGAQKKLVAISSVYASMAVDYGAGVSTATNRYAYRASKAALNSALRGLTRDWAADGVLVGILDPGYARTDMTGELAKASAKSISADESARGLVNRIAELTPATSGMFQRFWGEQIPW